MEEIEIKESLLDRERFGVKTTKVTLHNRASVQKLLDEAKKKEIQLIVARCKVNDLPVVQEMEKNGFFITDTLVYYQFNLSGKRIESDKNAGIVRPITAEDALAVKKTAEVSFKGYYGHYHADPYLDDVTCDAVYPDWAYRSCVEKTNREEVFVAEENGKILGFATMRLNNDEEGEGVLFGVAPEAQGRGIYKSFILTGLNWCKNQGCERTVVSTQVTNLAVQKVWTRVGFEPSKAYYTLHKWM